MRTLVSTARLPRLAELGFIRKMCSDEGQRVNVVIVDQDGEEHACSAVEGTDVLQVAWDHGIEMEGQSI